MAEYDAYWPVYLPRASHSWPYGHNSTKWLIMAPVAKVTLWRPGVMTIIISNKGAGMPSGLRVLDIGYTLR